MAQGTRGAGAPSETKGGASSRTTSRSARASGGARSGAGAAGSPDRGSDEVDVPPRGRARTGARSRAAASAVSAASTAPADTDDGARSSDSPAGAGTALEGPVHGGPRALAGRVSGRLAELPRLAADRMRAARAARAERAVDAGPGTDWGRVGAFGLGLTVGALVGAGAALLLAPATGFETRTRLVRRARGATGRVADRWDELTDDVERRARTSRRQIQRAVAEARWRAEDALDARRARALRRSVDR